MRLTINCDMGEGFGLYRIGDDAAMMPHIDLANVACGFHASDPSIMRATVRLAKQHGVKVGAHPSLPDLQGFGRRAMVISPAEVTDLVTYQTGALVAFLQAENMPLNHVKPHGALYGMAARDGAIAAAIAQAVKPFGVPVLGMAFTAQEKAYAENGVERVIREGKVKTTSGRDIPVKAGSVCVHSDTPGAAEIAAELARSLRQ